MKINYDPKADAAYIQLTRGKYEVSREISDSIVVDEDKKGKVLGIEILNVSKMFTKKEIRLMTSINKSKRMDYPQPVAHKISK